MNEELPVALRTQLADRRGLIHLFSLLRPNAEFSCSRIDAVSFKASEQDRENPWLNSRFCFRDCSCRRLVLVADCFFLFLVVFFLFFFFLFCGFKKKITEYYDYRAFQVILCIGGQTYNKSQRNTPDSSQTLPLTEAIQPSGKNSTLVEIVASVSVCHCLTNSCFLTVPDYILSVCLCHALSLHLFYFVSPPIFFSHVTLQQLLSSSVIILPICVLYEYLIFIYIDACVIRINLQW